MEENCKQNIIQNKTEKSADPGAADSRDAPGCMDRIGESAVDVICQHSRNGEVIPLRLRVCDEEGELHAYTIKAYRDLTGRGAYTTQDGIYVTDHMLVFECRIPVFGRLRTVRLYYDQVRNLWALRA